MTTDTPPHPVPVPALDLAAGSIPDAPGWGALWRAVADTWVKAGEDAIAVLRGATLNAASLPTLRDHAARFAALAALADYVTTGAAPRDTAARIDGQVRGYLMAAACYPMLATCAQCGHVIRLPWDYGDHAPTGQWAGVVALDEGHDPYRCPYVAPGAPPGDHSLTHLPEAGSLTPASGFPPPPRPPA